MPALRKRRMELFFQHMQPRRRMAILDVGGLPALNGVPGFWRDHSGEFDITLLNLPGSYARYSKGELAPYRLIEADACTYQGLTQRYDILFSNSVVEHVGSSRRQEQFAKFVLAAADNFWIQTPSPLFPIEAHCDTPFWWNLPLEIRKRRIQRWRRSGREFLARQMASTRPIHAKRLRQLFPGCELLTEHLLFFPKSQIAYRRMRPY
jgi:hypothetical protein